MVMHVANSCVRGFHVYSDIWTPFVGEIEKHWHVNKKVGIQMIAIKKGSEVAKHVLRKSSMLCLLLGETICCEITDNQ